MAEEKELQLDQMVTTLDAGQLVTFAKHLKIDDKEGLSKVRQIKNIRKQIDANLEKVDDDSKPGYLDSLIKEIVEIKEKTNSEQKELEKQLQEIELKRKEIEQKLSKSSFEKQSKPSPETKTGNSTVVSELASMLIKEFKIQGTIGEPGQKDKLTYQSLIAQIEAGLHRKYSDKEVILAVIRAVQPGLQLRSYLESVNDLTLERLRKLLRFHYHEKSATELYQSLTSAAQRPNEDPQSFLMRALTIRQKILFASKEADSGITYDSASVQSLFLHALETGLKDETIRAKIRPILSRKNVTDEELIESMCLAVSAETERSNKFNLPNNVNNAKPKPARVNTVESTTNGNNTDILSAIKALREDFASIQTEFKALKQVPTTSQSNTRHCDQCSSTQECNHCYVCGASNHFARNCPRRPQQAGNGRRLRPRDRQ